LSDDDGRSPGWRPNGPFRFWLTDFERKTRGLTDGQKWRYVKLLACMWEAGGWISESELPELFGSNWKRDLKPLFDRPSLNLCTSRAHSVHMACTLGSQNERCWTQTRIQEELDRQWQNANRQARHRQKSNAPSNAPSTSTSTNSKKEEPPTPLKGEREAKKPNGITPADVELAFENWNICAERHGLPMARTLTNDRKRKLKARLAEHGLEGWITALSKIDTSPFLQGKGPKGWRPTIEFLLSPSSLNKTIEGAYNDEQ